MVGGGLVEERMAGAFWDYACTIPLCLLPARLAALFCLCLPALPTCYPSSLTFYLPTLYPISLTFCPLLPIPTTGLPTFLLNLPKPHPLLPIT